MENQEPLPPMEILKTIAVFRFILPQKEIMIAGGRTVNLRDMQSMVFTAGASALMVGNYLTTLNQPVEKDLQMLNDLGLDPDWDNDFAEQLSSKKCDSNKPQNSIDGWLKDLGLNPIEKSNFKNHNGGRTITKKKSVNTVLAS